jgi:mannose-6-phosphate isomerase-like protein (cupin superfamily)
MKATLTELLGRIPGPSTEQRPQGERYALAFAHGTMSLEFYAPDGIDQQKPHSRDEIYIIHSGSGELVVKSKRGPAMPGDVFFVPAGVEHRFENFTAEFSTWVVLWGQQGGEKA